jgi:hypothetical protein
MNWKYIAALTVGAILALLGGLWFLQGSDLVHIKPILCFANCETLVGHSPQWQYTGAIAFFIGIVIIGTSVRQSRRRRKD